LSLFSLLECRARERELFEVLPEQEQQQALRMASDARRSTFIASRAIVRLVLALDWQVGPDPQAARLEVGEGGKLSLHAGGSLGIDISIAHSDELLAVAVSGVYDVGVDVEPRGRGDADGVAWSALSSYERAYLMASPATERAWQFRRMWTLKEALAKSLGQGSAIDFARLDTLFDFEPLNPLAEHTGGDPDHPHWLGREPQWFHQEHWGINGDSHWLALAARRRDLPRWLDVTTHPEELAIAE
jgi:phosphopantetheinyl transferase